MRIMSLPPLASLLLTTCAVAAAAFQYNPEPTGGIRLVWEVIKIHNDIERAKAAAEAKGVTSEEHYPGYALSIDPNLRKMQYRMHYAAVEHEEHILRVIANSKHADMRAIAATALGYTRPSYKQVDALVRATSDLDAAVRRNAARSLKILIAAKPNYRSRVPAGLSLD